MTDFLGKGFAFPLRTNLRGGVQQSRGASKVEESIRVVLGTQRGERLMRPNFGCNLKTLVFAPNNLATANLAKHFVLEGLTQGEPRIIVDEITVESDRLHGRLLISIRYRLRSTHEAHNLVYPFYLTLTGAR